MKSLKIYQYDGCSSCRNALKFLDKNKIAYEKVQITDHPPSLVELTTMLERLGGDFKKLFNTSGVVYRELGLGQKIGQMTAGDALKLLAKNGKLIKRPFVLTEKGGLVGFKQDVWSKMLL